MAKKLVKGTDGSATLPTGHHAKLQNYSSSIVMGSIDCTEFGDDWVNYEGTIFALSGSAFGRMEYDAASMTPLLAGSAPMDRTPQPMVLTVAPGCTLSFNAILSEIAIAEDAHGEAGVTFNFQSAGEVVIAWDETT